MKTVMKKSLIGAGTWLLLTIVIYGLSALIHGSTVVFVTGGARSLFLSIILTFGIFMVSYKMPQKKIKKKKPLAAEYLTQTALILALAVVFYFIALRIVLGFNIWELNIKFTYDMMQSVYNRTIFLALIALLGGYLGITHGRKKEHKHHKKKK